MSPVFKKGDRTNKTNYPAVSILSTVSKILDNLIFMQLTYFLEPRLLIFLIGFYKTRSVQYCLVLILEKIKNYFVNKGGTGILLTDLSNAFDGLDHDLLIAKLNGY